MRDLCNKIKALCVVLAMGLGLTVLAAAPTVTSVTAQQRYPWNGLVDIVVTICGEESDVAKSTCTFAATNSTTQMAMTIAHVTSVGNDSGSGNTWIRRFLWDTNADVGEVKIDDVELTVVVATVDGSGGMGGVQLWEGGPYWAECNVGASRPEEYGYYFWWGDTVGHAPSGFYEENCPTYKKTVSELRSLGYVDLSDNLAAAHDAAKVFLGAPWRMPTKTEFDALVNNCNTTWTTRGGVYGRLVTGRGAYDSRSIFLPAAGLSQWFRPSGTGWSGYYWSSTMNPGSSYSSYYLYFRDSDFDLLDVNRDTMLPVRPVRGFVQ